jgi:hypothetical protein
MKIRYKTGLAVLILVLGAFISGTALLTDQKVNLFPGSMALIVGIGYLVRPLAELTETELTVFALFGPLKRRYVASQLRLVNGRIYEGEKKVSLPAWTVHGGDWRALVQRIDERGGPSP